MGSAIGEFGFQPAAQPGILNLRVVFPEARAEGAEDGQMVQMQLNGCAPRRKVPLGVQLTDMKACNAKTAIKEGNNHVLGSLSAAADRQRWEGGCGPNYQSSRPSSVNAKRQAQP